MVATVDRPRPVIQHLFSTTHLDTLGHFGAQSSPNPGVWIETSSGDKDGRRLAKGVAQIQRGCSCFFLFSPLLIRTRNMCERRRCPPLTQGPKIINIGANANA